MKRIFDSNIYTVDNLTGAYILSPFSPMKISVNGEKIKLSSGYTVKKCTEKR